MYSCRKYHFIRLPLFLFPNGCYSKKREPIAQYSISVIRYYGCFAFRDVSDYCKICSLLLVTKSVFLRGCNPIRLQLDSFCVSRKVKHTKWKPMLRPGGSIRDRHKKDQYHIKTPFGFHIFIADYELLFWIIMQRFESYSFPSSELVTRMGV